MEKLSNGNPRSTGRGIGSFLHGKYFTEIFWDCRGYEIFFCEISKKRLNFLELS